MSLVWVKQEIFYRLGEIPLGWVKLNRLGEMSELDVIQNCTWKDVSRVGETQGRVGWLVSLEVD